MYIVHPHIFGDYITADFMTNQLPVEHDEFPEYPPWYSKPVPQRQIPLFPLGTFRNDYTPDCQIDFNKHFYGKYAHMYEITLTQPDTEPKDPYNLNTAFKKIIQSKMFQVIDALSVIELTKSGTPHLHGIIISKCYVNQSKINYPYRCTVSKIRNLQSWINYLMKDNFSPDIISYCYSKGIDPSYALQKTNNEETTSPEGKQEV